MYKTAPATTKQTMQTIALDLVSSYYKNQQEADAAVKGWCQTYHLNRADMLNALKTIGVKQCKRCLQFSFDACPYCN